MERLNKHFLEIFKQILDDDDNDDVDVDVDGDGMMVVMMVTIIGGVKRQLCRG